MLLNGSHAELGSCINGSAGPSLLQVNFVFQELSRISQCPEFNSTECALWRGRVFAGSVDAGRHCSRASLLGAMVQRVCTLRRRSS